MIMESGNVMHCPVCGVLILNRNQETVIHCPKCEVPHHWSCWHYNDKLCAVYACGGTTKSLPTVLPTKRIPASEVFDFPIVMFMALSFFIITEFILEISYSNLATKSKTDRVSTYESKRDSYHHCSLPVCGMSSKINFSTVVNFKDSNGIIIDGFVVYNLLDNFETKDLDAMKMTIDSVLRRVSASMNLKGLSPLTRSEFADAVRDQIYTSPSLRPSGTIIIGVYIQRVGEL